MALGKPIKRKEWKRMLFENINEHGCNEFNLASASIRTVNFSITEHLTGN